MPNVLRARQRKYDTIRSLERELQEYKNSSYVLDAQVFLPKTDLLSISDVKDKVNTLNNENFQASASLEDSLIHHKYEVTKEDGRLHFADVCRTMSEALAPVLMKEAQNPEPEVNPFVVQVVLEMYLVHFCSSKIDSWFL
jgi:hypothetical protein